MPQLDKNTLNYQLIIVIFLFASLFLVISWLAFAISFSRIATRNQIDLTATDPFKAVFSQGITLLAFSKFLIHRRDLLANKNKIRERETNYFKKSLHFFIITTLFRGNYRYALIMDKTFVHILEKY